MDVELVVELAMTDLDLPPEGFYPHSLALQVPIFLRQLPHLLLKPFYEIGLLTLDLLE